MERRSFLGLGVGAAAGAVLGSTRPVFAQTQPPLFATRKLSERAYVFRYQFHQSLFVVTPDGVIATDPIGYLRPQAVKAYIDEIRKVTAAPIKYLVYSHHHYDHIAGGQPFKDLGATVVAHRNARTRLQELRYRDAVVPDEGVDGSATLELGGVKLELSYVGRNHSDNSLVMLLPEDRLLFTVDFIPIETVQFRDMPDGYLPDWFESLDRVLAMPGWDQMVPGHPYAGGRLGTRDDVRNLKTFMTELSDAVKTVAEQGKCFDDAIKEVRLPQYEKWGNYPAHFPGNVERFCEFWARGY